MDTQEFESEWLEQKETRIRENKTKVVKVIKDQTLFAPEQDVDEADHRNADVCEADHGNADVYEADHRNADVCEAWESAQWESEQREAERQQRRRQRIEEMRREKYRREMMYRYGVPAVVAVFAMLLIFGVAMAVRAASKEKESVSLAGIVKSVSVSPERLASLSGFAKTQAKTIPSAENAEESSSAGQEPSSPEDFGEQIPVTADFGETMQSRQAADISRIGAEVLDRSRPVFAAFPTEHTMGFGDDMNSDYGIMIDVGSGEVLAHKGGWERINPASMTKILTLLVAAEHIKDPDDTFVMTIEITDYSFSHDCSNVGFSVGEEIPLRDLFYGTALQSGADAALGLAYYVAGSQEAFVELMNQKLEELGISETTHFTNCVGLYDENHYSTPYDMAVILKEASDNAFCREVLSQHHYVTSATEEHPDGIDISNWFLRRIEDRDTHGEVLCAKTGYVVQSKNCAASLALDSGGREYICVTAGASSVWTCIKDHVTLYQKYLPETSNIN